MDGVLRLLIKWFIFLAGFTKRLSALGIGAYDEWAPEKKLKLLMVGYNGARNTGADARVAAAVKQIRELFGPEEVSITVLTLNAETLEGYFDEDVELLEINSIYPKDLYRACSAHHAAVLCEGSTLKSTFADALSLFFCEASGVMARQGKPCIAFGSEVGYMDNALRAFASKTCRDTYFITRTQESQDLLSGLGLTGHKGTDTAWLYEDAAEPERVEPLLRRQGWDGETPLLGIAVIDPFIWPVHASLLRWLRDKVTGNHEGQYDKWYYYSDSPQRELDYDRYIGELAKAINGLCGGVRGDGLCGSTRDGGLCGDGDIRGGGEFFPVLLGMERMDIDACRKLERELEMPAAIVPSGENAADVMTGVLQSLSALITSRYHAAVLSMPKGCPIVAVSMDERLDSLMKEVGLEEGCLFHVWDEDLGAEVSRAVAAAMDPASGRKEEIRALLERRVEEYRKEQVEMGRFLKDYIEEKLAGSPVGSEHGSSGSGGSEHGGSAPAGGRS